jgi:predicted RNase H-like HicB family nuclease
MKINFNIKYFKEDDSIVALCPELQVSSFGETLEDAELSIKDALALFLEGCAELGTLNEIMEEAGFMKIGDEWILRTPVKTSETSLQLSERFLTHA